MDYEQTFVTIQALVEKDKAPEAFEKYKKIRFPWIENSKKKEQKTHIDRLMQEIKHGALSVTPLASPKIRSRMNTKVIEKPSAQAVRTEQDKLYAKIGTIIPK